MMGLTYHPTLRDAKIAKNYLSEEELKILNNLVSGYFDFAEIQAMKRRPMYLSDYVLQLDNILSSTGEVLLNGPGSVSHPQALEKAEQEYRLFQVRELSPVERAYLETIKALNAIAKGKGSEKRVNGGIAGRPFARNMHVKLKENEITIEFLMSYLALSVPRTVVNFVGVI